MSRVLEIRPSERIVIDTATLDALFQRLGYRGAEAHVMQTVEAISDCLVEVDARIRKGQMAGVAPHLQRVSRLSAEIGLSSLARVSRDMGVTAQRKDVVAYRAVWERLVRIGDRSLAQVWEVPELSL